MHHISEPIGTSWGDNRLKVQSWRDSRDDEAGNSNETVSVAQVTVPSGLRISTSKSPGPSSCPARVPGSMTVGVSPIWNARETVKSLIFIWLCIGKVATSQV
jgi:hypothetical protein